MKKTKNYKLFSIVLTIVLMILLSLLFIFSNHRLNKQARAALTSLDMSALPARVAQNSSQTVTVTAHEAGVIFEDYGGAVHFSSTDPSASLPSDYTFKNGAKEKAISINGWNEELQAHDYNNVTDKLLNNGVLNAYLGVFETTATGTASGNLFCENDFAFGGVTSDDYYDLNDFITSASGKGIDTYAWITIFGPEQTLDIDGDGRLEYTWVDPASTEHLTFINNLVSHLLTNYAGLKGVVIDYIRYADAPNVNVNDGDNIDEAEYRVYKDSGTYEDYTGNFAPDNATTIISNVVQSIAAQVHTFGGKEIAAETYSTHSQSSYDNWIKPNLGQDYALMAANIDFIVPLAYHIGWHTPDWVAQVVDFVYSKVNPANPGCLIWPKIQSWQSGKSIEWPGPGAIEETVEPIDYAKVGGLGFYVYDHTSDDEWTEIKDCFDDNGTKTFTADITFNQAGTFDLQVEDALAGISDSQSGIESFSGHPNGALIKTPTSPAVYFIKDGYRSWVPSRNVFNSRFKWNQIVKVTSTELNKYLTHPTESILRFREGTLFRLGSTPAVYVVGGGEKRWIDSSATFTGKGYKWSNILIAESQSILDAHPNGPTLTSGSNLPNGTLTKTSSSSAVYVLNGGERRHVLSPTVLLSQFRWQDIVHISDGVMNSYPIGRRYHYRNGSIVKGPSGSAIFFIDSEKKRHFSSASVYLGLGYFWDDYVIAESSSILDYHISGDSI